MTATFVDANVFVYAFLKPKRKLQPHEQKIKEGAKKIVTRINEGEETVTSVVHFSEICNILEDNLPLKEACTLEKGLLLLENIAVKEVSEEHYLKALAISEDLQVGANDALAYVLMKDAGINRIYSFDRDFNEFKDIQMLTE
ncbi:MAG: type II toxin-antitoxin system VapC family toxin [Candidatus Bathyarchaeota archaeon]|nr:type II toxin-antitoxin system VapC family toxin [Candidatus Bathyarchaeota archaeon]